MPWVAFTTKAQWSTFHDAVCTDLGIPRPGKRQSDGAVQLNNQWTDAAFQPQLVNAIIAGNPRKVGVLQVPAAAVTRYGLNMITDPIDNGDGTLTVTYQGAQYVVQPPDDVTFPVRKPKPASWTDPDTGTNYPTGAP